MSPPNQAEPLGGVRAHVCVHACVCACVFPLRLPSISLLNGSVVTDVEREDAERFFIRYYQDYPEEELPCRYAHPLPRRTCAACMPAAGV